MTSAATATRLLSVSAGPVASDGSPLRTEDRGQPRTPVAAHGSGAITGLLRLQRQIGNRAVGRLLNRSRLLQRSNEFPFLFPGVDAKDPAVSAAIKAEAAATASKVAALGPVYDALAAAELTPAKMRMPPTRLPKEVAGKPHVDLTDTEVGQAFIHAWHYVFQEPLPARGLQLLFGHWNMEGGNNKTSNNNLGNVTIDPKAPYFADYVLREAAEIDSSGRKQPYAVYDTPTDGAIGMIHWMAKTPGRRALLAAIKHGATAEDYVYLLKRNGYFTAPVHDVFAGGKRVAAGYLGGVKAHLGTLENEPTQPSTPATPLGWATRAEWDARDD